MFDSDGVGLGDAVIESEGELEALCDKEGVSEFDAVDEDDGDMLGEATWLGDIELLELASCVDDDEALTVIVCEVDSERDCACD